MDFKCKKERFSRLAISLGEAVPSMHFDHLHLPCLKLGDLVRSYLTGMCNNTHH